MTVISYQEWLESGRTRRDLRQALADGSVRKLRRSVLTDLPPGSRVDAEHLARVRATAPFLGARTYFSRFSAAAVHGLPLLRRRLDDVTVVRTGGGHGSIAATIHARRASLDDADVAVVDGLPVTGLARTVADLIRELPFEEAVMVADAALHRGLARDDVAARIASGRGCRRAASVIGFADDGAESPGESLSRVRMWQAGIVMPTLQHVVCDHNGNFLGRSDFYWEHCDTAGEFDGAVKYDELAGGRTPAAVLMDEKRREARIRDVVRDVVRWTWPDLWDDTMVHRVAAIVGLRDDRRPAFPIDDHPSRRRPLPGQGPWT